LSYSYEPGVLNLRTFSFSVRIFSQLDAFRLAVRQHAKFDDRPECCRQPEQPAMRTGPDLPEPDMPELDMPVPDASARCQCQMPVPDASARCPSKNAGARCLRNSGFEYAVSTETSKNPSPNHTLRRDSYADATVDLAYD
jgi:hypothetical protein